jgi:pyridoxine 5-phosphate synthase
VRLLTLSLDALAALRDATEGNQPDLAAAATLAELVGADFIRLGVAEELRPVRGADVQAVRRAAAALELRMAPVPALVKVALETRPERLLLASEGRKGRLTSGPLDFRAWGAALPPVVRTLHEAGLHVAVLVSPDLESVKAAHAADLTAVEFFTGALIDLPEAERRADLERLTDATRLAAKLRLSVGIGGGLGMRDLATVLAAAPAVQRVAVGRSLISRALLVGLDRAVRDFRERLG